MLPAFPLKVNVVLFEVAQTVTPPPLIVPATLAGLIVIVPTASTIPIPPVSVIL